MATILDSVLKMVCLQTSSQGGLQELCMTLLLTVTLLIISLLEGVKVLLSTSGLLSVRPTSLTELGFRVCWVW